MNLFIDTTQSQFVSSLFDNNFQIKKYLIKETKYKVEEIINFFNLIDNVNKINNFYINIGPGSFTGSRIALLYIRTLAQINNSNIYIIDSFSLLKKSIFKKNLIINANKNKSFIKKNDQILLIDKSKKERKINYKNIIFNFKKWKNKFELSNIEQIKPLYAADPNIGIIKRNC